MCKDHRKDVSREMEDSKYKTQAMETAQSFTQTLLDFDQAEELVFISKEVKECLKTVREAPGCWATKLAPASSESAGWDRQLIIGQILRDAKRSRERRWRGVLLSVFSAKVDGDTRDAALCDVAVNDDKRNHRAGSGQQEDQGIHDQRECWKWTWVTATCGSPTAAQPSAPAGWSWSRTRRDFTSCTPTALTAGLSPRCWSSQLVWHRPKMARSSLPTGSVARCMASRRREITCAASCRPARRPATSAPRLATVTSSCRTGSKMPSRSTTPPGNSSSSTGSQGSGYGQLNHPYGVCADKYGHIIIADTWNNRIHLLSEDGKFMNYIVTKEGGMAWPQSVIVDKKGNLVVVEQHGTVKVYQYLAWETACVVTWDVWTCGVYRRTLYCHNMTAWHPKPLQRLTAWPENRHPIPPALFLPPRFQCTAVQLFVTTVGQCSTGVCLWPESVVHFLLKRNKMTILKMQTLVRISGMKSRGQCTLLWPL